MSPAIPLSSPTRHVAPRGRVAVLAVAVLAILAAGAGLTGGANPAEAATTVPGQSDGVRVTPIARIVGEGLRDVSGFDVDANGNVYAAGFGWDSPANARPSRHLTTTSTATDLGPTFLVKMDAAGSIVWSLDMTGDSVHELKADGAGNVWALGVTGDGLVGGVEVFTPGFPTVPLAGAFVAKFKADGTGAAWVAPTNLRQSIGINPTGTFAYVGGTNGVSPVINRINPATGAVLWTRIFGGDDTVWQEKVTDIVVLPDGAPVATGYFGNVLYLDWPTKTNALDHLGSTFVVRYDVNGTKVWHRQLGGVESYTRVRAVLLPDGNLAIGSRSRYFQAKFDGIVPPTTGYDFAFVSKIRTSDAAIVWTSFLTSDGSELSGDDFNYDVSGLDVDTAGNIAFGSSFQDKVTVHAAYVPGSANAPAPPSVTLNPRTYSDIAVSFSPAGAIRFARATTGADVRGDEGVNKVTRELRALPGGDLVQAGNLDRAVIGTGEPNSFTMAQEVLARGVYVARLRTGGATTKRPPEPPTFVKAWGNQDVAASGASSATVAWKPPADTGGSPITGYRVVGHCTRLVAGPAIPDRIVNAPANGIRTTVTGLSPGTCNWVFVVRANNAQGHGAQSEYAPLASLGYDPSVSAYHPLADSLRIMDTRDGTGPVPKVKLGPGATIDLYVDRFITPGFRSRAVALNVTAILPSQATHLTVWPRGEPVPPTSSLNAPAGSVVPNFLITKIDDKGYVSIRNNSGSVDVAVDMVGYFEQFANEFNTTLEPMAPVRLLDTRNANGVATTTPIGPGGTATFAVAGRAGIPTNPMPKAVLVNVTGTNPSATTHLTLSPSAVAIPGSSNLNLAAGQTAANMAIANLSPDGKLTVYNNSGTTHAIVDVVGWYARSDRGAGGAIAGSQFKAISPTRALDTRDGTGLPGGIAARIPAGGTLTMKLAELPELQEAGAPITAVAMNVTAVNPTVDTHITVWPGTSVLPDSSNLNLPAGAVRANLVVAAVGTDGTVTFRNNSGQVDLIADVTGAFVGRIP